MHTDCMIIIGSCFAGITALFVWLKQKDKNYKEAMEGRLKREKKFMDILEGLHDTRHGGDDDEE